MTRFGKSMLAVLVSSACGRAATTEPDDAAPAIDDAPVVDPVRTADAAPAAAPKRVPPAVMPAALAAPPATRAEPPPGTPNAEGRVAQLLAIDGDRAIVRFIVPGPRHTEKWWLALVHADGSVGWVRTMSGDLTFSESSNGIERVGDAVSITTTRMDHDRPEQTLHAFALSDGRPRYSVVLGHGFLTDTAAGDDLRIDARVEHVFTEPMHTDAELIASGPQGIVWRAPIGESIPVGYDPMFVGDAVAIRTEDRPGARWHAFDRATGAKRGELAADPQGCSDGRRLLVRRGDELVEVDPMTMAAKSVLTSPELPGAGKWAIVDCVFAETTPVVLLGRGPRNALAAIDTAKGTIIGHVEIGTASIGLNGFDPLPRRAWGVLAVHALASDGERELIVADPRRSKLLGSWRGQTDYVAQLFDGGYLVTSRSMIAVVDGTRGELEGRAVFSQPAPPERSQIAGTWLWIPPEPLVLGRRAPWVIGLAAKVDDDVRDAVLLEMRPTQEITAKAGKPRCPDPRTVIHGDGLGTDGTLGPVARTRLPTWDLDILKETARTLTCAPGNATTRVLAWYVIEDDRPLRNDNALLVVEDVDASPPRWSLVSVYRHATNREWNTAGSFHDPTEPVRTFDHRPTKAEIDDFLAQADWTFADSWGRVIAGNVIDDEWRAVTGEAPWHAFAAGIEQRD
jgi:hypothetical protein